MNFTDTSKTKPIPHNKVVFHDSFWQPRLTINREHSIPYQYEQCKKTGRIDAFRLDWKPGKEPVPHFFWDSDVAKWVEAASYSIATHPDPELEALLDEVIELIAGAQQPDGYLNVYFTVVKPEERWTDLRDAHELYCAGHLIEAGVAHYLATGKRRLLDVVCKYADYIDSVFGREPGKLRGYPGHQEIELALVKLYRVTGEERYLRLSQYFVDERGQEPHYFDIEEKRRGNTGYFGHIAPRYGGRKEYNQAHLPVREQTEAVGHAVRAMYLYSAMADLAYEIGDESLYEACLRLWDDVVKRKMYVTGGIGSTGNNEGFTTAYDLPNQSYAETCAAIGLVFWNHRLLQLDCDRKYADILERALYNGVICGMSLDGTRYFYANPLESKGDFHRQEWFGVSCCPPNLARLLASLGQYVYSYNDDSIVVHLYAENTAEFELKNQTVTLTQKTNYPWDGLVEIMIDADAEVEFSLKLRIPGWCEHAFVTLNGNALTDETIEKGYLVIDRKWRKGDVVQIQFSMPIMRVYAHPFVRENVGKVALQRGPLVYCIEDADHDVPVSTLLLPKNASLTSQWEEDLLNGVVTIVGDAIAYSETGWDDQLYSLTKPDVKPVKFKAIPYYAWDNREPGEMAVWIKEI